MIIQVARGFATAALVFVLAFSSVAIDAKRQHHHHRNHHPHKDKGAKAVSLPWAGGQTVYIHNHTIDPRWDSVIEQTVADLNHLTEYMPHAPRWVYLNDTPMSCAAMHKKGTGLQICTTQPGDSWYSYVAPPGCPVCAATTYPKRVKKGRGKRGQTNWVSNMTIDDTDYVDPAQANECGTTHDQPCSPAWRPGDRPWRIVHHEFVHGILNLGHQDHSAAATCPGCTQSFPWGRADFAQAEALFGPSSVEFCALFPEADDCQ